MVVPFPPGGAGRHVAPPGRRSDVARPRPAGRDREQGRRRRRHRHGPGRQGAGRRLHDPDGAVVVQRAARGGQAPRPRADVPAQPVAAADRALHGRPDGAGRARRRAVEDRRRTSSRTRRSAPAPINYGSSGNYGTMHVPMEILAQNAGIKMTHVPFTGAGPAVVALLGGQIDAVVDRPGHRAAARQGRQAARAGALGQRRARGAARRAVAEGGGLQRRVRAVVGPVRARGHARAGRAAPARRRARRRATIRR